MALRQTGDLLRDDTALEAGVHGDLTQRGLRGGEHDVRADHLVVVQALHLGGLGGLQQCDTAAGHDALLNRGLGVADGVLDAVLALLQLHLGGGADLDDGHAAGQLREALLQLLAVVVGVGVLDLAADLGDAALDLSLRAIAVDDGALVLGDDDLAGPAQQVEGDGLERQADLLGDHLAASQDGDVAQHGLAAVAEARGLDGDGLEGAAQLVDDQAGQGLALDILGHHQQRLPGLHDLLQHGKEVLQGGDLGVDDQDVGIVEGGLHPLRVGDEVRGDVALVEAHALGQFEFQPEGVGLLDGDHAFLADLVHGLGDDLADAGIGGGDRRGGGDLLLGLDVDGQPGQLLGDGGDGGLDALLQGHRVGAGGDVAQTLADHCLGHDGGGGGAVAGDVIGLLGDFLDQLCADLLVGIVQLDLLGDGDAVIGDGGGAPLLLEHDIAALGAEGDLDRVCEGVHAPLEAAASLFVEFDELCHGVSGILPSSRGGAPESCCLVRQEQCPRRTALGLTNPTSSTRRSRVPTTVLALHQGECKEQT